MDNYQIERIVGRGGFGTVYLCKDKKTFRNVIIKQIPVEQMTSNDRQVLLFIFDFKKTNILYIRSTLYICILWVFFSRNRILHYS